MMRTLYHQWLCPFSRAVRFALREKNLDFTLKLERLWEKREEFFDLNPAGTLPVLVEENGTILCHHAAILEYLEEAYPEKPLLEGSPLYRAEVRRLVGFFNEKVYNEAWKAIVYEKLFKRYETNTPPSGDLIRQGSKNLHNSLRYIENLLTNRHWLAGDTLSYADIVAGAHISVFDYLGDIIWSAYPETKDWYARLKSRPSFRPILQDQIPGFPPAKHYTNLDF